MADVLTPAQRRLNMSRIKGSDTKPELVIRRGLHAMGLRYRLHCRNLPGSPDIVFPRYRALIFVHGCFWHMHGCHYSKMPRTRVAFWQEKISKNALRDANAIAILRKASWRVIVVWECALRGVGRLPRPAIFQTIDEFIRASGESSLTVAGEQTLISTRED